MTQEAAPRIGGDIALGRPDTLRVWWMVALGSSTLVVLWLMRGGAPVPAIAALCACAAALWLRRRFLTTFKLGTLHLLSGGDWVARNGNSETRLELVSAVPWPGVVLLGFACARVRYPAAISQSSAGPEAYRQLLVRLRNPGPENAS